MKQLTQYKTMHYTETVQKYGLKEDKINACCLWGAL
uniref:Uncharacterized protein n=1 Tax=Anguilla anguilla TaxID=7936 RepID=A0A0E9XU74_ANGAN